MVEIVWFKGRLHFQANTSEMHLWCLIGISKRIRTNTAQILFKMQNWNINHQIQALYLEPKSHVGSGNISRPFGNTNYSFITLTLITVHCTHCWYCLLYILITIVCTLWRLPYLNIDSYTVHCIISFLTMEYLNQTLQYYTVHSLGSIRNNFQWE